MAEVNSTIEVNVPLATAYNQWTQFESFPRFMDGVHEVRQLTDDRLHWKAEIGGESKEWDAQITQQVPDSIVAWKSLDGVPNNGTVFFKGLNPDQTEIDLHMEFDPESMKEEIGSALGVVSRRVEADLKRFKEFIEERGAETGAWRGEIPQGEGRGSATGSGDMPV